MAKFALWWIRWNENLRTYESRMTVGGRNATAQDFKGRGFDRIIVLDGEGRNSHCSGFMYSNGYNDGRELAKWILTRDIGMPLYITIPFYRPDGKQRDQTQASFSSVPDSYYRGWIDGILSVDIDNMKGFYWSYESCLQTGPHGENVSMEFIQSLHDYVHGHGQELIWIPTLGNRTMGEIQNRVIKNLVTIPTLAKYFDHVFVQPHYYQTTKLNDGNDYTFEELVSRVKWMKDHGLSIEMEVDNSIIGEQDNCAYCKSTQGTWEDNHFKEKVRCDKTPTLETEQKCIDRACDYYRAIIKVSASAFSTRAYYFGTNLKVIDKVRTKCPGW
ncbi:hypothetical protein APY94_08620 [Thermococcus celericrescens]|uniref:DUF4855 domain-containing protein n=1 Tax=Thermococcus celericrescens TaxID=227598 RepID=A0A117IT25_9EURY|nr:DUF4855 domain-containing protein [Thermococcus celericrescens]KUH32837.1 hypothetical protein APY94_08620 [Thermococcus celericrescens]